MENQTLKEVYKNSNDEVKAILREKFSKQDLGIITKVNQEEFNQFFREILEKYKKNVRIINNNLSRYEIFDDEGYWLFEVDYNPKYQWFFYSQYKIFPLFHEKFGVTYKELNELMIPVVEQDFKLMGVTPRQWCKNARIVVEQDLNTPCTTTAI